MSLIELETIDEFHAHLARVGDLRKVVMQSLDLRGQARELMTVWVDEAEA